MKKFLFKLETLLQYRVNIEEKERLALSRLNFTLQTEINQRDRLRSIEQETLAQLTRVRSGAGDEIESRWYYPYLDRLRLEIERSNIRIASLEKEISAQKIVVVESSKKRKVLDTLKTKKVKEFTAAVEKQEQKAVDEIVVTRFARRES